MRRLGRLRCAYTCFLYVEILSLYHLTTANASFTSSREHRQRKENHIRTLEQEISDLRDMIESAEKQSHIFKLENDQIKKVLDQSTSNHLNTPQPHFHGVNTPTSSGVSQTSQDLATFVENIASVDFDELMNVSYLQLKQSNDFGLETLTAAEENTSRGFGDANIDIKTEPFVPYPAVQLEEQMDPSQENPEVALKAINFILAYVYPHPIFLPLDCICIQMLTGHRLEHPCRTHFLPKGDTPTPGLPVLPAHVPSGHECMFSFLTTYFIFLPSLRSYSPTRNGEAAC